MGCTHERFTSYSKALYEVKKSHLEFWYCIMHILLLPGVHSGYKTQGEQVHGGGFRSELWHTSSWLNARNNTKASAWDIMHPEATAIMYPNCSKNFGATLGLSCSIKSSFTPLEWLEMSFTKVMYIQLLINLYTISTTTKRWEKNGTNLAA